MLSASHCSDDPPAHQPQPTGADSKGDEVGSSEGDVSGGHEFDPPRFDLGVGESTASGENGSFDPLSCEIDFLFVIDDSISMAGEQRNLATSVPGFVEIIQGLVEVDDFHIGVTTTSAYEANVEGCRGLGGLVVQTGGKNSSSASCGPFVRDGNYLTARDDIELLFPCIARPGTEGSNDERPMQAMLQALGGPLLADGACNAGFVRDGALLVVTLVSDAEDDNDEVSDHGSPGDPQAWYTQLLEIKGDPRRVVVLSLIGIEEPNQCAVTGPNAGIDGAEPAPRIAEFTKFFGKNGHIGDVCADDYAGFFREALTVVDRACDNIPPAL